MINRTNEFKIRYQTPKKSKKYSTGYFGKVQPKKMKRAESSHNTIRNKTIIKQINQTNRKHKSIFNTGISQIQKQKDYKQKQSHINQQQKQDIIKYGGKTFFSSRKISLNLKNINYTQIKFKTWPKNNLTAINMDNNRPKYQQEQEEEENDKNRLFSPKHQQQLNKSLINPLKHQELFYCCYCYLYVFGIQKRLHYPKCQSNISLDKLTNQQKKQIGWQRITKIQNLSIYINMRSIEVENLCNKLKQGNFNELLLNRNHQNSNIHLNNNKRYFRVTEMQNAIMHVYETFLKDTIDQSMVMCQW